MCGPGVDVIEMKARVIMAENTYTYAYEMNNTIVAFLKLRPFLLRINYNLLFFNHSLD